MKIIEDAEEFFNGKIPGWVKGASEDALTITASDWQGPRRLRITPQDVVRYCAGHGRSPGSGGATLAGHFGDWRPINELAETARSWFEDVAPGRLYRVAKRLGWAEPPFEEPRR